jgi:flagellar protein FliO/FliZ
MWDLLFYVLIIALLAMLVVVAGVIARGYLNGTSLTAGFFGPKADPRIFVSEQASVDGRRRLLLVRRDDVEHLIMTGGPVDVVIETGISVRSTSYQTAVPAQPAASFERAARAFGQKASDG